MIPLVLAGIAGLALVGNPPRRKLHRRNPLEARRSAQFKEFGLYDVTLSDGTTVQISRDAGNTNWWYVEWPGLHYSECFIGFTKPEALAALEQKVALLRHRHPKKTNPHLGNKGDEFKKHASLRLVQDAIEKEFGKHVSLEQVKALLADTEKEMRRRLMLKQLRVIEGRRRANPASIDVLAIPVANMFWRKHGYQSPGHAEDLAMMARRGTTAHQLWARVAAILKHWLYAGKKRSNPRKGR